MGSLERSSAGHTYILVVCDYATRYPKVFPLKKVKARQIANCLIQMFARVGIPKEITDQGTNFTSKLLKEVTISYQRSQDHTISPIDRWLVERFNKTLKSIMRKFVSESGSDWDQWLSFLLFAYREVPRASTGFSHFQLLYGPWDILKEAWESTQAQKQCNVL